MSEIIKNEYEKWLNNSAHNDELRTELENMTQETIDDAFYTDLEFGTAGMRGIMGPGTNRMNLFTIRKANVGFAQFLLSNVDNAKNRGVAIAYDSRNNSYEFALESAIVLGTFGIKTYLFDGPRPTPELSYAVRHLDCAGGIVITASHNPPAYNGYKIYDESGSQVLPDDGDKVIAGVNKVKDVFSIEVESETNLKEAGLINIIGKEIDDAYLERVKKLEINSNINKSALSIVFSPLHGTAGDLTKTLLTQTGYTNLHIVEEQEQPDGAFPTVNYPNPEDPAAFEYAIKKGKDVNADILLATDPDADRMGVAAKNVYGEYVLLTGNQTGAILTYYIVAQRKLNGSLPTKGRFYDTIVSSRLGAKIAETFGLTTMSTLTGFKFIGEQARYLENTDETYVFGYEESYGSLIGDFVRDKDAIQAVLLLSEVAAYYKEKGQTLLDVLNELYEIYGYYQEDLVNISLAGKEGNEKIKQILAEFRKNPPTNIAGSNVVIVEDYQNQTSITNNQMTPILLPSANVLKYTLDDGSWFVLRPSGTEPKAKVYIGVVTKSLDESTKRNEAIKKDVLARVNSIIA